MIHILVYGMILGLYASFIGWIWTRQLNSKVKELETSIDKRDIVTDYETGYAILKKDAVVKELHQSVYLVSGDNLRDVTCIFKNGLFVSKIYFAKSNAPKWDRKIEECEDIGFHFKERYYKDNVEVKNRS